MNAQMHNQVKDYSVFMVIYFESFLKIFMVIYFESFWKIFELALKRKVWNNSSLVEMLWWMQTFVDDKDDKIINKRRKGSLIIT